MPQPTIEELISEFNIDWDEVKNRIKRLKRKKRIAQVLVELCRYSCPPHDAIEYLLAKLPLKGQHQARQAGHILESDTEAFGRFFWMVACEIDVSWQYPDATDFSVLFVYREASVMKLLLTRYFEAGGEPIPPKIIQICVHLMWIESSCKNWWSDDLRQLQSFEELENEDLHDLWAKTLLFIRASQEDGLNKPLDHLNVVHNIIEWGLPKLCLWVALRLLPASFFFNRDDLGRLPLHMAAIHSDKEANDDVQLKGDIHSSWMGGEVNLPPIVRDVLDTATILEWLLEVHPESASQPDNDGMLPLGYLLASNQDTSCTERNVAAFFKHAPLSLTMPNPKDNMLPFMIAGASNASLTVIYSLLLQQPSAVASGIKSTDREIWLTDKLAKAQARILELEAENTMLRLGRNESAPPSVPFPIYKLPTLQYPARKRRKFDTNEP